MEQTPILSDLAVALISGTVLIIAAIIKVVERLLPSRVGPALRCNFDQPSLDRKLADITSATEVSRRKIKELLDEHESTDKKLTDLSNDHERAKIHRESTREQLKRIEDAISKLG